MWITCLCTCSRPLSACPAVLAYIRRHNQLEHFQSFACEHFAFIENGPRLQKPNCATVNTFRNFCFEETMLEPLSFEK